MTLSGTMSVAGLTDEQRETFEREGYLVVPGALEPGKSTGSPSRSTESGRRTASGPGRRRRILCTCSRSAGRTALPRDAGSPTPLRLVVDLLGWNIFMYHCHLDVHPPIVGERPPAWMWHQDGGSRTATSRPIRGRDVGEGRVLPRRCDRTGPRQLRRAAAGRTCRTTLARSRPGRDDRTTPGAIPVFARRVTRSCSTGASGTAGATTAVA